MSGQLRMDWTGELVVDNFAGGGGASIGIEAGLGRPVDVAINHDREAIGMHMANHPATRHLHDDLREVDPAEATGGPRRERKPGGVTTEPRCGKNPYVVTPGPRRGKRPDVVMTRPRKERRCSQTSNSGQERAIPRERVPGRHWARPSAMGESTANPARSAAASPQKGATMTTRGPWTCVGCVVSTTRNTIESKEHHEPLYRNESPHGPGPAGGCGLLARLAGQGVVETRL